MKEKSAEPIWSFQGGKMIFKTDLKVFGSQIHFEKSPQYFSHLNRHNFNVNATKLQFKIVINT